MTGILRTATGWECLLCRVPWDGSVVSEVRLPAALERQIAAGCCSRRRAFEAFLRMNDLADAMAAKEITFKQGIELVALDALAAAGRARAQ